MNVPEKAAETAQETVEEKAHAAAASRAVTANPDAPAVVAAIPPARSHRRQRLRSRRHHHPQLRARPRSAARRPRKLRLNHRQNPPIIRIFRRFCCDRFVHASEPRHFATAINIPQLRIRRGTRLPVVH
jgi:hypothetical protein